MSGSVPLTVSHLTYRGLLDALPIPVFLVNEDVQILDLNQAAAEFCRGTKVDLRMRWGGEVLHCLNAQELPSGCGGGHACGNCVIRKVVGSCLGGSAIRRRRFRMEIIQDGQKKHIELLLTASPMSQSDAAELALLMVEDVTEMSVLKDVLPICMKCKKIRNDDKLWQDVDVYLHQYAAVDFTHGVCPACRQTLVP